MNIFKKIGIRNELLVRFKHHLNQFNPNKLDDLLNMIYHEGVTNRLQEIKNEGLDNQSAAIYIIKKELESINYYELSDDLKMTFNTLELIYTEERFRIE